MYSSKFSSSISYGFRIQTQKITSILLANKDLRLSNQSTCIDTVSFIPYSERQPGMIDVKIPIRETK